MFNLKSFSFSSIRCYKIFSSAVRNLSVKTLVLKTKKRKSSPKKASIEGLMKKARIKSKYSKTPSDYCEDIWLDHINLNTLKLYRKTSFGSFRKINVQNLLSKLETLNSSSATITKNKFDSNETLTAATYNDSKISNHNKTCLSTPQMSEYLVKNMLSFPLFKTNCDNNMSDLIKEEKDMFGVVDSVQFPSVTKILNETMTAAGKARLEEWKKKMTEELGEEGFQKYSQDKLMEGVKLHRCLKKYLESDGKEVEVDPVIIGCWGSLEKLLPNISNIKMVEESIQHPVLMYKGVLDCVATYENVPCLIEWKKSEKIKSTLSSTYDAPLQLCAYLGALSWQRNPITLKSGLIIIAYTSGEPANIFSLDLDLCQYYWTQWLRRLQTYWLSRSSISVRRSAEV